MTGSTDLVYSISDLVNFFLLFLKSRKVNSSPFFNHYLDKRALFYFILLLLIAYFSTLDYYCGFLCFGSLECILGSKEKIARSDRLSNLISYSRPLPPPNSLSLIQSHHNFADFATYNYTNYNYYFLQFMIVCVCILCSVSKKCDKKHHQHMHHISPESKQ